MLKNLDDRAIIMSISVEERFFVKWREYLYKVKGLKQKDLIKKIIDNTGSYLTHPWQPGGDYKIGLGLSVRRADRERILNLVEDKRDLASMICTLLNSYMEQNPISEEA